SDLKSEGWGVLSTDDCQNVKLTAINSTIGITGESGYGAYAIGNAVDSFFGCDISVPDYSVIITGGNAVFGDSTPAKLAELNSSLSLGLDSKELGRLDARKTTVNSGRFGIMWHGQGTVDISGGTVFNTEKTVFLDKGAPVIINVDGSEGARLNPGNGVIMQVMDNDDPGPVMVDGKMLNIGVYTEPTGEVEADAEHNIYSADSNDAAASFSGITLAGDFYNSARGGIKSSFMGTQSISRNMSLTFDNSKLSGVISSSKAVHAIKTITAADYLQLGDVSNFPCEAVNNGVMVSLSNGSAWTLKGTSYLTGLTLDATSSITAPEGYAVSMTLDGVVTPIVAANSYTGKIILKLVYTSPTGIETAVEDIISANSTFVLNGKSITDKRNYVSSTENGSSAIYATSGAAAEFINPVIVGNGTMSSSDTSAELASKYGYASALLVNGAGTDITLFNPDIDTFDYDDADGMVDPVEASANGAFASNGAKLTIFGGTIDTNNALGHGLDATYQAQITATDTIIKTHGIHSGAIATDFGGGIITLNNVYAESNAAGSPGIYTAGMSVITATGSTIVSNGCEAVMAAHDNGKTILNECNVTGTVGLNGHNSMTEDYSFISMNGGTLTSTAGAAITEQGGKTDMTLDGVDITVGAPAAGLINPAEGKLKVTLKNMSEAGIIARADQTWLDVTLSNTNLIGPVEATKFTVDADSSWVVDGDSYISDLSIADPSAISAGATTPVAIHFYTISTGGVAGVVPTIPDITFIQESETLDDYPASSGGGGTPPGPPPGTGGGGVSETYEQVAARITSNSTFVLDGNSISDKRVFESSTEPGASAIYAKNGANYEILRPVIVGHGTQTTADTKAELSSKYGYAAAILVNGDGTQITLQTPDIDTFDYDDDDGIADPVEASANGAFSTFSGILDINGGTIDTNNGMGHGLDATYAGMINAEGTTIYTKGAHSGAVATDFGGGFINVLDSSVTSEQGGSPGIYCAGKSIITAIRSVITALGCEAVMAAHDSGYTRLYDSTVTGTVGLNGHNSMTTAYSYIIMDGGSLTGTSGAAITEAGGKTDMTLKGVAVSPASGASLIEPASGRLIVTLERMKLTGNIVKPAKSYLEVSLVKSDIEGSISATSLTLDPRSSWEVTGDGSIVNISLPFRKSIKTAASYLKIGRGRLALMSSYEKVCDSFDFMDLINKGIEIRATHPVYSLNENDDLRQPPRRSRSHPLRQTAPLRLRTALPQRWAALLSSTCSL
ncbi:MAG: hypothetical protein HGA22_05690, partial [Clostridiales bacterium]|nr:hypothetical protein [Clostridiales bacterium]